MKKLIIFILILKSSLIFSQNFNDKIIPLTGDTISGLVMSVDIMFSSIKNIIICKDNHPQITLSERKDTIIKWSNNILPTEKKLIIKQTTLKKKQNEPICISFTAGEKIVIKRYKNKQIVSEKIESITDSAILIKGTLIKIDDIQRVSKRRGGAILIYGLSSSAFLFSLSAKLNSYLVQQENYDGSFTGPIVAGVLGFFDFIIMIPAGCIQLATTKHYRMDKGWKLIVK